MLTIGTKAPNFTLFDKNGNAVSLSDFWGRRVVLYFYPKDNTPGCTRQACAFAGAYKEFEARDVVVIGISRDSVASHQKFAEKYELPFILLSDPDRVAIEAYDVWQEKKNYGKVSMGVVRSTYLIDAEGKIEAVMPNVKPDTNAAETSAPTEIPTEPADTTTEPIKTEPPKKKGCRSSLGMTALLSVTLCAGWLVFSKKHR